MRYLLENSIFLLIHVHVRQNLCIYSIYLCYPYLGGNKEYIHILASDNNFCTARNKDKKLALKYLLLKYVSKGYIHITLPYKQRTVIVTIYQYTYIYNHMEMTDRELLFRLTVLLCFCFSYSYFFITVFTH